MMEDEKGKEVPMKKKTDKDKKEDELVFIYSL